MNTIEQFILKNHSTMSRQEMADILNVSVLNITYYLRKNNLVKKKLKFSQDDIEYMHDHYLDMTYKEIANHLGYTERQIRGKINNFHWPKTRRINSHYFDEIDNGLKAYFLGFIFADGWIIFNEENYNYEFGMQLQSEDDYILKRLNEELGGLNIITYNEPYTHEICGQICHTGEMAKLRVYSKPLVLGLMKNGIATNKTLKHIHPIVKDEFFFDFLRGYIDGDGCYWKYKNHYYLHITCATDTVLKYIQNVLFSYNIETKIYQETERKYRLICMNITEMSKLIPLLYPNENVFCLSRKYERIKSYLIGPAA